MDPQPRFTLLSKPIIIFLFLPDSPHAPEKMFSLYPPYSLINPILSGTRRYTATTSLNAVTSLIYRSQTAAAFRGPASMENSSIVAGCYSKEHVAGNWYSVPELRLRDHLFSVPLDYSLDPSISPKISVFAREVVAVGKEEKELPFLLYLQGGPGYECPQPTDSSGWIRKACEEFRVIFMDQRGTGESTPLTVSSMLQLKSADKLADYLRHFRADNIVNDAELIRVHLVPEAGPWTVLGQSYGGFCAVTYLSFAAQGLKQVLLTGGIPPIGDGCTADAVYRACKKQVILQNDKFYQRYPQDLQVVQEIVKHLAESESGGVTLPSGGILTPRGLQTLGLFGLGMRSGFERLHYLLQRVWDPILVPGAPKQISYYFLRAFESWHSFDTNPLYALLHEPIYCQGGSSNWSAQRVVLEEDGNTFDALKAVEEGRPVLFTGEMIFPWMFDEIHALRPFKEAASILSQKEDWPPLYDCCALKNNKVPVSAAVYYEDMFVNFKLSTDTARQIGNIRLWVTNEYMHSGLREEGDRVLDHLFGMMNGKNPLF